MSLKTFVCVCGTGQTCSSWHHWLWSAFIFLIFASSIYNWVTVWAKKRGNCKKKMFTKLGLFWVSLISYNLKMISSGKAVFTFRGLVGSVFWVCVKSGIPQGTIFGPVLLSLTAFFVVTLFSPLQRYLGDFRISKQFLSVVIRPVKYYIIYVIFIYFPYSLTIEANWCHYSLFKHFFSPSFYKSDNTVPAYTGWVSMS